VDENGGRRVQPEGRNAGLFGSATLVRIPNVEVVREASTLLWCRADGREFYVPREMLVGDALRKVGDRGLLIVPDWFARDRGFVA
jgi:hypothetical protein